MWRGDVWKCTNFIKGNYIVSVARHREKELINKWPSLINQTLCGELMQHFGEGSLLISGI